MSLADTIEDVLVPLCVIFYRIYQSGPELWQNENGYIGGWMQADKNARISYRWWILLRKKMQPPTVIYAHVGAISARSEVMIKKKTRSSRKI